MKDKLLSRITSIIAIVLLVVSVVLVGLVYLGGSTTEVNLAAGGDDMNVPNFTDALIYWCYFLLIATACVMVIFAIMKFVKNFIVNPKGGIKTIVILVGFVLIFLISWFAGSPDKVSILGYEGSQNVGFWAQLTDMIMYTVYTLFALLAVAIVGGVVYTKIK
ncbi:hypothetical protein LJB95_01265 [Paludibacteraceae bacterium OttesenSCG-928-F17]|nr:hypothetical protein [Paludibacteraceae bacterium OttesenSCG-928-F17]